METISSPDQPASKEYHYELVKHEVIIAQALPPYASRLYEVLLYHIRYNPDGYPGYEALMRETGFKSKSTVSKYLKVLEKVGLIKKRNRRGYHQSNLYFKQPITNEVKKQLTRKSHWIIEEIAEEDEKRRQLSKAKKELDVNRIRYETRRVLKLLSWYLLCLLCAQEHKSTRARTDQYSSKLNQCEVHGMDAKRINTSVLIQTPSKVNMNSSIDKNVLRIQDQKPIKSTVKILAAPKGLTKLLISLPPALQHALEAHKQAVETSENPIRDNLPSRLVTLSKQALSESGEYLKLDETTKEIETEFADRAHYQENQTHTRNLYERAKKRGITDLGLIDQMFSVRGLIREMLKSGKLIVKKMAYFYRMLENRLFPTPQMQGYAFVNMKAL